MTQPDAAVATRGPHGGFEAQAGDRLALAHLADAYCHAIDRRDYRLLRSLYHDDAIDDHSPFYCGPVDGYVAWLPAMLANWSLTAHSISNRLFVIDGDRAEGELYAKAYHRTADGARAFVAYGRYADRYRKADGVWRFAHRAFILDWSEDQAVAAGSDYGVGGVDTARAGADDPCYARLAMFGGDRAA